MKIYDFKLNRFEESRWRIEDLEEKVAHLKDELTLLSHKKVLVSTEFRGNAANLRRKVAWSEVSPS